MDLINMFLNLVAPPFTFFSLLFFWPPFQVFKYFLSLLSYVLSENVAGKVVLITGASSGIGEHLAYEYAKRGACLVLTARRESLLEEVAELALDYGSPDVIAVGADVSRAEDCRRIVDEAMNHFGRLDHLVNNAGISSIALLEETADITEFRQIMDINFWGSVYTTRFAIPYLRNSRGKIVVLSSSASWLPTPRMSIYNASKAALKIMFETLRVELGGDIGITIVTPGSIESEITRGKFLSGEAQMKVDQDMRDVRVGLIPVGSVEGCAKAIVNSVCRGDRSLADPAWIKATYFWKVFCPELIDWSYRLFKLSWSGASPYEAPSKTMLDITGARNIVYPSSLHSAEVKQD